MTKSSPPPYGPAAEIIVAHVPTIHLRPNRPIIAQLTPFGIGFRHGRFRAATAGAYISACV